MSLWCWFISQFNGIIFPTKVIFDLSFSCQIIALLSYERKMPFKSRISTHILLLWSIRQRTDGIFSPVAFLNPPVSTGAHLETGRRSRVEEEKEGAGDCKETYLDQLGIFTDFCFRLQWLDFYYFPQENSSSWSLNFADLRLEMR